MKKIVIAVMAIALLAGCGSANENSQKACKDAFAQADEGFQLASVAILAAATGNVDKMNQITAVLTQLQPQYQSNKDKCTSG